MKRCPKCQTVLPIDAFHRDRSTSDGLCSWCRACSRSKIKKWCRANPDKTRGYAKKHLAKNPNRGFAVALRSDVGKRIRTQGGRKSGRLNRLLGCNFNTIQEHIESLFWPGMSWNNQGRWHLDHVLPCTSFDLTAPEEQLKCFHYTNYQPLWKDDNHKKRNRLDWSPLESKHSLPDRLAPKLLDCRTLT